MHLNPYGEYAVLLAASLANAWPADRAGIVDRTREFGMTMPFPESPDDHHRCRLVLDDWLTVVDADSVDERAAILNRQMAAATAYPRLTNHPARAGTCTTGTSTTTCRGSCTPWSAWAPPST